MRSSSLTLPLALTVACAPPVFDPSPEENSGQPIVMAPELEQDTVESDHQLPPSLPAERFSAVSDLRDDFNASLEFVLPGLSADSTDIHAELTEITGAVDDIVEWMQEGPKLLIVESSSQADRIWFTPGSVQIDQPTGAYTLNGSDLRLVVGEMQGALEGEAGLSLMSFGLVYDPRGPEVHYGFHENGRTGLILEERNFSCWVQLWRDGVLIDGLDRAFCSEPDIEAQVDGMLAFLEDFPPSPEEHAESLLVELEGPDGAYFSFYQMD